MTTPTLFADYINRAATIAGYDLTGPRSGGKKALAHDAGMSHASVCRMLAGHTIPEARFLHPIATALDVPVGRLFELAGLIPEGVLSGPQPASPEPLTPSQAAGRLGIHDPVRVGLFTALTDTLRAQEGATP